MADLAKLLEEVKGMTVLELNDFVKMLEEEFGVSAAAMAVAGPATGAAAADAPAAEEQTEFTVVLKEVGGNKIAVIKAVREITGLGLSEAKAVVDGAPSNVKEGLNKEAANEALEKLKAAGATAELK